MMRGARKRTAYGSLLNRDTGARKTSLKSLFPTLTGELFLRSGILLALVVILTTLFPTQPTYEYTAFREGAIAPEEVIAPETFHIYKNEAEYRREVSAVRRQIPPILVRTLDVPEQQQSTLKSVFQDLVLLAQSGLSDSMQVRQLDQIYPETRTISESTIRFLLNHAATRAGRLNRLQDIASDILDQVFETGLIESKARLRQEDAAEVVIVGNDQETRVSLEAIHGIEDITETLQEDIERRLPSANTAEVKAIYELVVAHLKPSLVYDTRRTENRRDQAAQSISQIKGTVLRGERIIDEHDRVTSEKIEKLRSLATHMNQRRREDPYIYLLQTAARAILSGLLVAILFVFLKIFRETVYRKTAYWALFAIILLMPALVAYYAATVESVTPLLVPIALSAMLATVLFDAEVGLVVSLVSAMVCASILSSYIQHSLIYLITGIVGAYSVRKVLHRSDFYRSIFYLALAYSLAIAATGIHLFTYASATEFFQKIKWDLVFGVFTACASSVLTIGLLPIFESVFDAVTPITLLELSDLNRPLLRNLAIRAPGTYSHSIIMASLSEAAADAIGADRLLVRVGCYYHDIGKMIRPHYFIENQKGVNPHDELQPKMSALILISHVKEGVELAEEEGLPRAIIDLIPQHHGTSEIASFKHRALERGDKQAVRDEDFRYPGPKPQTKEAGIISLADAVESATRTLSNNSPDRLKGMVQTIVKGRFTSGELDECDLTLKDLTKIQEAFLPILQATRHSRVVYPWQQQQVRQPRERKKEGKERA